jgi:hypothetical protein
MVMKVIKYANKYDQCSCCADCYAHEYEVICVAEEDDVEAAIADYMKRCPADRDDFEVDTVKVFPPLI